MTMHCACNNEERDCSYPKCHTGERDRAPKPIAAQIRFRHPQKNYPDWSVWMLAEVDTTRPDWYVDSVGYEVEYRLLYARAQDASNAAKMQAAARASEVSRLHEELAKANGACADMALELLDLLRQVEAVEADRNALQARCEQMEARIFQLLNRSGTGGSA